MLCWCLRSVTLHVCLFHLRISKCCGCVILTSQDLYKGGEGATAASSRGGRWGTSGIQSVIRVRNGDWVHTLPCCWLQPLFLYSSPCSLLVWGFIMNKSCCVLAVLGRGAEGVKVGDLVHLWEAMQKYVLPLSGFTFFIKPTEAISFLFLTWPVSCFILC